MKPSAVIYQSLRGNGLERYSALDIAKGASVVLVGVMTLLLLALPQPGYRLSRLVPFVLVILLGWIGAAGAFFERYVSTLGSALQLFLLGFWQCIIGLVMLPTSGAQFLTALLRRENTGNQAETPTV